MTKQKKTDQELVDYIKGMRLVTFKNAAGEKFNVHSNGVTVMLSGDEVDSMVADELKIDGKYIPLFNSAFGIWQADELRQLGQALKDLHPVLEGLNNGGLIV